MPTQFYINFLPKPQPTGLYSNFG